MYKVLYIGLTLESVDKNPKVLRLKWKPLNSKFMWYWPLQYAVQGGSNFWVSSWNP